jgi:hypothetical protein
MQDFDGNKREDKEEQLFNPHVHRIGYSDNWECDRCSLKGYTFYETTFMHKKLTVLINNCQHHFLVFSLVFVLKMLLIRSMI